MKTTPFKHQQTAFDLMNGRKEFALFCEMGTGKSKILIDDVCRLWLSNKIMCVLIIAPKGVIPSWYSEQDGGHLSGQLPAHMWPFIHYRLAVWSSDKTKKAQADLDAVTLLSESVTDNWPLRILLMNVEAISTRRGVLAAKEFLIQGPSIMIVDESTTIKTGGTNRSKGACWLGKMATYRRILTGMPIEQSPLDLYGQCEFLKPGLLGHRSFYSFRGAYANLVGIKVDTPVRDSKGVVMNGHHSRTIQKVTGYKDLERLSKAIKDFSFRVTKEECLDLPEKLYQTRTVELTDEQRRVYKTMRDKAVAELSLDAAEGRATAPIVITQLLRLHQIVCGWLPLDGGGVAALPNNRLAALMEVLEEAQGKVIIWATYRRDITAIVAKLGEVYEDASVVSYYGETSSGERPVAIERFQNYSTCRFFVGTPGTAGMGLTLTAANTVVYYSNSHSVKHRVQSEDRAHRIGQTKAVTYIDLVSPRTVDESILVALKSKRDLGEIILNDGWRDLI